jgi:hypothetical protein
MKTDQLQAKTSALMASAAHIRAAYGEIVAALAKGRPADFATLRTLAKQAARQAATLASYARGRERARCKHEFPAPDCAGHTRYDDNQIKQSGLAGWHWVSCRNCNVTRRFQCAPHNPLGTVEK